MPFEGYSICGVLENASGYSLGSEISSWGFFIPTCILKHRLFSFRTLVSSEWMLFLHLCPFQRAYFAVSPTFPAVTLSERTRVGPAGLSLPPQRSVSLRHWER